MHTPLLDSYFIQNLLCGKTTFGFMTPPSSLRCIISMLKVWKGGAFAKPPFKDFSVLFQVGAVATTPLKLFAKWVVPPPLLLSLSHHKAYLELVICTPPLSLSLLRHFDVCLWGVCFRFQPFKNFNTGSLLYNGLRVLAPPPSLPPLLSAFHNQIMPKAWKGGYRFACFTMLPTLPFWQHRKSS